MLWFDLLCLGGVGPILENQVKKKTEKDESL